MNNEKHQCEGGCGRKTVRTVRMLREQDAGTADALGWAELSVAPMRVAVYLCRQCQADDVVPEGYAEEPRTERERDAAAGTPWYLGYDGRGARHEVRP